MKDGKNEVRIRAVTKAAEREYGSHDACELHRATSILAANKLFKLSVAACADPAIFANLNRVAAQVLPSLASGVRRDILSPV